MKIGIDVSQLPYTGHGVGRYVAELARALLALDSPHTFTFYAGALQKVSEFKRLSHSPEYSKATWHILPIPPRAAARIFNISSLSIDWFIGRQDVFHSSDWTQPFSKAAKVTTVHDLVFHKYPETVDPKVRETHTVRLDRIHAQGVHIIADSLSTKKDLQEIYQFPDSQIDVIYPGVNGRFTSQSPEAVAAVKAKYQLPDKFILSIGTKEPRKNLGVLVQAFQQFRKTPEGEGYSLVMAGRKGWGDKLDVDQTAVISTGYIEDADLPALYSGAQVFAFPSLYEGFGFPVLEAFACGTPVVTSNISSLPEVAGKAAILVDPNSVSAVAEGLSLAISSRDKLIGFGLKQAATFTWERAARETMAVYEKLYEGRKQ